MMDTPLFVVTPKFLLILGLVAVYIIGVIRFRSLFATTPPLTILLWPISISCLGLSQVTYRLLREDDHGGVHAHCRVCGHVLLATDLVDVCEPCDKQMKWFARQIYWVQARQEPRKIRQ